MDKTIYTKEYYVASLDLLGAKNLICNDDKDKTLNSIKNIYYSWLNIKHAVYSNCINIKIFSDNIIVAAECDIQGSLDEILVFISYMAEHFLKCGYKVRGGITKGNLYIDNIFVWGKALVDAYVLESKIACYPRIIIDKSLISIISDHIRDILIDQCEDGYFMLNYLKSFGSNAEKHLDIINNAIKNLINENVKDESIQRKNDWLMNFLSQNKAYWDNYEKKEE